VSHFMAHDGLNFLRRAAAQQVVLRVAHGVPKPLTLALMRVVWRLASIS